MAFKIIACDKCEEDVEIDEGKPTVLLDPNRDKVKSPLRLHICSGKAPSLSARFKKNPEKFLESHVIVVNEHGQFDKDKRTEIANFTLLAAEKNAVKLELQTIATGDAIKAYWLPWLSQHATSMTLGADADFFFTSEMTNCRFSVLDANKKTPKVAHTAGDLSTPSARDKAEVTETEETAKFREASDKGRMRSLSISDSRDKAAPFGSPKGTPGTPAKHPYKGQTGDKSGFSSAFVFGVRDSSGDWAFFAQITKGTLADGFFGTEVTKDLEVLKYMRI